MSEIKKINLDILSQDVNYTNKLITEYENIKANRARKTISLIKQNSRLKDEISIGILSFLLNKRCGIKIEIEGFKTILKERLSRTDEYIDTNYSVDELFSIVIFMNTLNDKLCRPGSASSTASSIGGFYKQKVVKVIRKY